MRNIWTIAKREYDHFFISPIAYVVAFLILLTTGIIFAINVLYFIQNAFQTFGQVPDIGPITGAFGFLLVLSIPAVTMRLLADEARMGTLELLLTAPITDFELVAGKWLGGFLFILTIVAITLVYPLILHFVLVSPGIDQQLVISSYLGVSCGSFFPCTRGGNLSSFHQPGGCFLRDAERVRLPVVADRLPCAAFAGN